MLFYQCIQNKLQSFWVFHSHMVYLRSQSSKRKKNHSDCNYFEHENECVEWVIRENRSFGLKISPWYWLAFSSLDQELLWITFNLQKKRKRDILLWFSTIFLNDFHSSVQKLNQSMMKASIFFLFSLSCVQGLMLSIFNSAFLSERNPKHSLRILQSSTSPQDQQNQNPLLHLLSLTRLPVENVLVIFLLLFRIHPLYTFSTLDLLQQTSIFPILSFAIWRVTCNLTHIPGSQTSWLIYSNE